VGGSRGHRLSLVGTGAALLPLHTDRAEIVGSGREQLRVRANPGFGFRLTVAVEEGGERAAGTADHRHSVNYS
jgi:hypothetical protein